MRRTTGLLLSGLLLATLAGCGGAPEDELVRHEVADDPTITFKVWFKVGSQDDPPGKEGLAYLTGQLISEGSTTENSYEQILEKLYPLASSYTVAVDRQMTVLSGRTHKDNLDTFYKLFTEAYLAPAFSEDDFERIKTDILNYLKNSLRYASDEELGKAALYAFIFEGTPYAHPSQGTVQSLESITLEDVRNFYLERYTGSNSVAALGGGFDEELAGRFVATLDELPDGEAAGTPAIQPAVIEGLQVLLVDKPDADASVSFGFPIEVRRGERDFYALWIANSWLGEHRNSASHLYQVIREKRGMNYGDYSYIEAFPRGGIRNTPPTHVGRDHQIFEVWIRTLPSDQAHFALRAALRELQSLIDNGMTQEEFELTRSFLSKYVLHFAKNTSSRLGYAVDDRFYGVDGAGHLARFREMMGSITLDEVNAAIRKHLQDENVKIAIVTGDAEGLAKALVEDAPSPMTYKSEKPAEVLEEDKAIEKYPLVVAASAVSVVPVDRMFEN